MCRLIAVFLVALAFVVGLVSMSSAQSSVQQELNRRGLTLSQAQQLARQAGINPNDSDQIARLARQNGVSESQIQQWLIELRLQQNSNTSSANVTDLRAQSVTSVDIVQEGLTAEDFRPTTGLSPTKQGLPYFGYEIFSDTPDLFKPSASGPVDEGYVIGPEDELRLTVWGATEFQYDLQVDIEGRIFIPSIGQITVAGQQLRALRESLRLRLGKSYSGLLRDPQTVFMDVTITRLRPIKVFVLGEVNNPGGYVFSSNSTLFNILYGIGGPKVSGSLRDVQIIRDGRRIASIDLYDLLLKGVDPRSIPLLNNDRIFIPLRKNTISIDGPVRRPAIYELIGNEDFDDLLGYAGGLEPEAYGDRFQIRRVLPLNERQENPSFARELIDYSLTDALLGSQEVDLNDGDQIRLFSITNVLDDVVTVYGEVNQAGTYQLSESVRTVRDLILSADDLKEDALRKRAILTRTADDSTKRSFTIDLDQAFAGDPENDLSLEKRDVLQVFSNKVELIESRFVTISGAVTSPGRFEYVENMTLEDLILKAGGFSENAYLGDIELVRNSEPDREGRLTEKITYELIEDDARKGAFYSVTQFWSLLDKAEQLSLQHRDEVFIRSNPDFDFGKSVVINGEVTFPGRYRILDQNERISEIITRVGGITSEGYAKGAELLRNGRSVVIELDKVLSGDNDADIYIQEGDELTIPEIPNTVLVTGNVGIDGFIKYKPGKKLTYYLDQAGGMKKDSYKYVLLTQANGATYQVKRKGWFKSNPSIDDGAVINVIYEEPKPTSETLSPREFLQETTALLTGALTIILLVDRVFVN